MIDTIASLTILPVAFALDHLWGDSQRFPHPVRWMGRMIEIAEPVFRKRFADEAMAGLLFALSMVISVWLVTVAVVEGMYGLHPALGWMVELLLVYFALSAKSLRQAAEGVYGALREESLAEAKRRVSMIVGRDVDSLSRKGVIRATVETVAENLVDGVMSPVFYAAIGGAPLAMAFKMISTLDSMVGYKTPKYVMFGKASARMDDLANYIPARLAIPVISLAAQVLFGTGRKSWLTAFREGNRHSSPNAGRPEAAFAGALGVKLGGPNTYCGQLVDKPYIGNRFGSATTGHIPKACELMTLSAFMWTIGCWAISSLFAVLTV